MKRTVLILIVIFMSTFLFQEKLHAYSTDVHKEITKRIIDQNFSKLNKYIVDYTGLTSGLAEFINKKPIRKWIEHGSEWEDYDIGWVLDLLTSHYYNPYTNKGLTEAGITIGVSAYDRANDPSNYWGWKGARESFYIGLTSTVKNWRETKLADSFDALGHVMHLIQDMGVPAHTRDDMHVPYVDGEPYEAYTKNNSTNLNYTSVPFPYWNVSISPNTPKQFWDLDSYDGTVAYDGGYIGLSEYTHANFLSKDTIFKYFPHPARENTNYYDFGLLPYIVITTPDNINHNTFYISGYGKQRLAALKYLAEDLWSLPILPIKKYQLTVHLDNRCHEEYAQNLVPRAVGYSVGLLDYFFRGQLQVTTIPILYKNNITYLRVRIKNITPTQEIMMNGNFALTYRYTPTGKNPDGSEDILGQGWFITDDPTAPYSPTAPCPILPYAKREPGKEDEDPEMIIDFWLPTPIPRENYDSAKFTLAFKGTLGNEEGAVIGKALTLGEIKFEEEWNNGLTGNHTWAHTGLNYSNDNPDNGMTSNRIEGDCLIKDNIRFAAYTGYRCNESFVGHNYVLDNDQFIDILPILVTPDTYIQFKIDEMWINQRTPAPPGYINDWQHLVFRFNNNLFIQYSVGQGINLGSTAASYDFDPNLIIVDNIYELFKKAGITIPAGDLYLKNIDFTQQLKYNGASEIEYQQHMKIDSIRIVEGNKQ